MLIARWTWFKRSNIAPKMMAVAWAYTTGGMFVPFAAHLEAWLRQETFRPDHPHTDVGSIVLKGVLWAVSLACLIVTLRNHRTAPRMRVLRSRLWVSEEFDMISREIISFSYWALQLTLLGALANSACAQDSDLAKKLSNPVAAMISVPLQFNYDGGYGPDDGYRAVLNIQPVIPISLNDDWNLISRTIIPVIQQNDIVGPSGTQFGMGDITQSFFFSPSDPGPSGIIWGAGPVFLLPTATDEMLGAEKFGIGPTAVVLKQMGGWTIGGLGNHIWSVAGDNSRPDISSTYIQPFISYTTPTAWTFTLNTESSYDWKSEQWSVPINLQVSKLVKFGDQPVSLFAGARYWAESPEHGPEGVAFRTGLAFLFPK